MAEVQTVQGAVDAAELGLTLAHEHVRFRDEAVRRAVAGPLRRAARAGRRARGGPRGERARRARRSSTPTAMFGGRDVRFMARVAEETGVRIVACTGIYSYDYLPHYFENRDVDVMADHFVEDIETGIQGTGDPGGLPEVRRRRRRGHRERREDPPRRGPRERADRRADHGPLDARRRHRPAPGRDLQGGGRRPLAGADRALRRHRGRRLHRVAARPGRLRRAGPLRPGDVPADRQAQRRRRPSCCVAATPSASRSPRTSAPRSTGSRRRPPRSSRARARSATGR